MLVYNFPGDVDLSLSGAWIFLRVISRKAPFESVRGPNWPRAVAPGVFRGELLLAAGLRHLRAAPSSRRSADCLERNHPGRVDFFRRTERVRSTAGLVGVSFARFDWPVAAGPARSRVRPDDKKNVSGNVRLPNSNYIPPALSRLQTNARRFDDRIRATPSVRLAGKPFDSRRCTAESVSCHCAVLSARPPAK